MSDLEKMKYIYDKSQACPVNGYCDLANCKPCSEKIWNNAIEEIRADERERIMSIVSRCIPHNVYNVLEGKNLLDEIIEEVGRCEYE